MLTKATAKLISELKHKKHRQESGLFVVEGTKLVAELLVSKITVKSLFATADWIKNHEGRVHSQTELMELTQNQLDHISFLTTPQEVLALARIPEVTFNPHLLHNSFSIALDTLQDPGNLGTIIRIADWYGIKQIICSPGCVDVYNPKVIQATMGSFLRVQVLYTELDDWFEQHQVEVMGAVMDGDNLYDTQLPDTGVLLIGNEGSGIQPNLLKYITKAITIPKLGGAESLNAGIATAIICDNWARSRRH
jgi:RNA methyltransferase, TrmH family